MQVHMFWEASVKFRQKLMKDDYYKRGDFAGRDGIEYTYENNCVVKKGGNYSA